jgi:hypothetical protein
MKALAARARDTEDIRQLVQILGLHTVDDVLASVRQIFPNRSHQRGSGSPANGHLLGSGRMNGSPSMRASMAASSAACSVVKNSAPSSASSISPILRRDNPCR